MKKFLCMLMALVMSLSLFACTNEKALAVEEKISALGEITLESGDAIAEAEAAFAALEGKDKAEVKNIAVLNGARIAYQQLLNQREADEIEKLIHALRPITMNSAEALASAEEEYNSADVDVKLQVENFPDLVNDFQLYRFLKIDLVEKKITAIGTVTEDSGPAIEEAKAAFDELPEEDRSWVYNAYILKENIREFEQLQATASTEETTETEAK